MKAMRRCGLLAAVLVASGCGGGPGDDTVRFDSDGDGFSDQQEVNGTPGTDPQDPTDRPDRPRDSDADGCSDFDELNFGGFCDNDPNSPGAGGLARVSGRLRVGATAAVDGDTLAAGGPDVDNDLTDPSAAQALTNPCTLSGYLGERPAGTDISDFYRVNLAPGQAVTLRLANAQANDFDLFLYDQNGAPLDSSEGTAAVEQVTAPAQDIYLVQVFAFSVDQGQDRGGLYTLLIGDAAPLSQSARSARLSSLHDFVEDEVLVTWRPGRRALQAEPDDELEVEVMNAAAGAGGVERLRVKSVRRHKPAAVNPKIVVKRPTSPIVTAVKVLRRRTEVASAAPNYIRRPVALPNDEHFSFQWHYPLISVPEAWDVTTGDPGVIVAVIDTGVLVGHPDLQGQLVEGFDFISDAGSARDGDGIDPDPDDPGDLAAGGSSTFHGTHVAGTIAARTNNGLGVAGVAPDVRVMPLRVLGRDGGTDFDIAQAIRYAARLANVSGDLPPRRADIINMSLGGPGFAQIEQDAVDAARAAGVIVIAASGNDSANADQFTPAGLDGVVTVGAVDARGDITAYSNFGSSVEVAAPGGDMTQDANGDGLGDGVLSTLGTDDGEFIFEILEGTSMASPHVAGVVALMKSINPDMTPADLDLLLAGEHPLTDIAVVDDRGQPGKDLFFGHGLINALGAVRAAAAIAGQGAGDEPLILVSPRNLDFGGQTRELAVEVRNGGTQTLEVTGIRSTQDWVRAAPGAGGEGTYVISVERGDLPDGVHTAELIFESNGGDAVVAVRMAVGLGFDAAGDIGVVHVLLVDGDQNAVAETVATAEDGYSFEMRVAVGTYSLFAGTDLNGNGLIDDPGEFFGAFPTVQQPQPIEVAGDVDDVSFAVSPPIGLQNRQSAGIKRRPAEKQTKAVALLGGE